MPQPRHSLCRIGCGHQWHQRSAGTADAPVPVDLEWPRRATVGAIAVIGVTRLASFAGGTGMRRLQLHRSGHRKNHFPPRSLAPDQKV